MKIILTGGTGFIGSNLIASLSQNGHEVVALTRNKQDSSNSKGSVEWIEADLSAPDWDPVIKLPGKADAVIHLAQSKLYREFPEHAADIYAVNTAATFKLLDYGYKSGSTHFIYASTGSIYNGLGKLDLSEGEVIEMSNLLSGALSFYCASKFCGEVLVESFRERYANVASLRIFAPYGQGGESALVNRLVDQVEAGEAINIQGDPGVMINPIHINDFTSIIEGLLDKHKYTGLLNVAGLEQVTLTDIVTAAAKFCGKIPDICYHSRDLGTGGALVADIRKLRAFGLAPKMSIEAGIQGIVNSFDFNEKSP